MFVEHWSFVFYADQKAIHETLQARKFRSFDVIETISTIYCRKFKKLKGLYDHCWQVLEADSCCVKAKRARAGAGKCFLSTVDQITVTCSRPINTLNFSTYIFVRPLASISCNTTTNRDIFPWGCSPKSSQHRLIIGDNRKYCW